MFPRSLFRFARAHGWRGDLACCGFGVAASLALPPLHLIPLLLLAFSGLLAAIDAAPAVGRAFRRGWWFGFGLHLVGLYWVTEAILFEAARFWWLVPLAVPALAAVLAVFIGLAAGLAWYAAPGWRRVLALAGAWTLLDLARQFVLTGFPWNPIGSVWAIPGLFGGVMIQPAALAGVHGLTALTVLVASLPVLGVRGWAASTALLVGWASFGAVRLGQPAPAAPNLAVVLVQGNVVQGQKWNQSLVAEITRRYLALTQSGVVQTGGAPAVVIWPETATPFLLERDQAVREAISDAAGDNPILTGAVRFAADSRPRNTLFALLPGGLIAAVYDKWHLVPFGEYQPDWLPLGIQVVPGGGFASGSGPRTLHVPGLPPFGPLICYEAIFPGEIVDQQDRPAWLVNITNDAWFGNSSGPRQHLAAARLRAVEEGLPLMRAANTGISVGFDARGHELGRLDLNEAGTIVLPLPGALPPPMFARYGLLLTATVAGALYLSGLAPLRRWRNARP